MNPTARRLLLMLLSALGVFYEGSAVSDQPAVGSRTAAGSPSREALIEYHRPELVAITWSTAFISPSRGATQVAWRPDGSLLDAEELAWIRKDLTGFDRVDWHTENEHRALVVVFRIDERAKSQHPVAAYLRVGDRVIESSRRSYTSKSFLAASSIAPQKTTFAEWPGEIDIDVQWQLSEKEQFKRVEGVPKEAIVIDQGVRWFFDGEAGRSRFGQSGYPACVLEIAKDEADPLLRYSFVTNLEGGNQGGVWRGPWTTSEQSTRTLMATQPLDENFKIANTDFYRLRYRRERIEKIPTFPSRMLK
jgi:hypothetical protein